jgi:hypothetical protein
VFRACVKSTRKILSNRKLIIINDQDVVKSIAIANNLKVQMVVECIRHTFTEQMLIKVLLLPLLKCFAKGAMHIVFPDNKQGKIVANCGYFCLFDIEWRNSEIDYFAVTYPDSAFHGINEEKFKCCSF